MEQLELVKGTRVKSAIEFLNEKFLKTDDKEERKAIRILIDAYINRMNRCNEQNEEIRQLRATLNKEPNELLEKMVEDRTWEIENKYQEELEDKEYEIKRIQNLYEFQCQTNARMINEFLDKKAKER